MRQIVIGNGEIGSAIAKVLGCDVCDKEGATGDYDVLHICYPPIEDFVEVTKDYIKKHNASLVVIHSTVPVGTTDKIPNAVHSPVRGVHPDLEKGIRTFVKFFGGKKAKEAAGLFLDKGVKVKIVRDARTSEALKLWSTEQYRRAILLNKEIWQWCQDNDVNFSDVYTESNLTYNAGYTELGRTEVMKPVLKYMKGKIGGHCLEPNHKILFDK